jgi:hypothetical protein
MFGKKVWKIKNKKILKFFYFCQEFSNKRESNEDSCDKTSAV